MSHWPHRIYGVTDHALIRFLARAAIPGYDTRTIAAWIAELRRDDSDDSAILKQLADHGVVVGWFRKVIQDEVDAHKRAAQLMEGGRFLIRGPSAPYVVSRSGYVITTLRRQPADALLGCRRVRAQVGVSA